MPRLSMDNVELYYEEYGTGENVVLSAQMELAQGDSYQRLLALAGLHVYYIQLRGFGKSTHVTEAPAAGWYPTWAEDVYQVSCALGVDRFIYTGVSHGAGVGWYLALAHPESLRAFVSVVGGPHDRTLPRTRGIGVDGANPPPMFEVPTADPERLRRRAERARHARERWARLSAEERAISPGRLFPELATNADVAQMLGRVAVPTLLLYAAQDDIIPPGMALLAARTVPGAKLVLYQDHSHSLASEAPQRLVDEVVLFMQEIGPA
ncbi:MAG TPA: alpha/beta fold hydrolase [Chloroflexota bacterium]|nr:alpha/beta fold hydrolase [Chloroflexota bacterium]